MSTRRAGKCERAEAASVPTSSLVDWRSSAEDLAEAGLFLFALVPLNILEHIVVRVAEVDPGILPLDLQRPVQDCGSSFLQSCKSLGHVGNLNGQMRAIARSDSRFCMFWGPPQLGPEERGSRGRSTTSSRAAWWKQDNALDSRTPPRAGHDPLAQPPAQDLPVVDKPAPRSVGVGANVSCLQDRACQTTSIPMMMSRR